MKKLVLVLISVLSMAMFVACDDDDGGGSSKFSNNDEFIAAFTNDAPEAICKYFQRCPSPETDIDTSDLNKCKSIFGFFMQDTVFEMQYAFDQGASYSEENYNKCFDIINNAQCSDEPANDLACEQIIIGTSTEGQQCSVSYECAAGLYCDTDAQCPGSCKAYAAENESCDNTECLPGLNCGQDGKCVNAQVANDGESCENAQCAYGLSCGDDDICYKWVKNGESCVADVNGNQTYLDCEPGYACDTNAGVCAATTTVGEGEACDDTHLCDMSQHMICMGGSCVKLGSNGEACTDLGGGYKMCWFDSYCDVEDICHFKKVEGADCSDSDECLTGTCNVSKCVYDPCEGSGMMK